MRSHDLAGERLRARRSFAERLNLLALFVELLNHVALVRRRLCKQPLERESLFGTLIRELLVRDLALRKLCDEAISFGGYLLQPASQLLKKRSPLCQELFELLL
jgi:hypothetical protein